MLEIVNLFLREGGISCSYAFLGICEAIFRGRDLIFCVETHLTLGARNRQSSSKGGISCSYAFLRIYEANFRGRDLIFCVEPHISIYFTDFKYFFNLNNMEPAQGCPA